MASSLNQRKMKISKSLLRKFCKKRGKAENKKETKEENHFEPVNGVR